MASLTIAQDHYKFHSPMRAKFQIYDVKGKTKFYDYNPFTATGIEGQPLKMFLNRGFGHHGNILLTFENSGNAIDKLNITTPCRIKVQLSKEDGNWTNYLSTIVRKAKSHMHQSDTRFYTLTSYGLGQRANERVLEFDRTTPDVLDDGITLDPNDVQQQADEMIKDTLNDHNEYPSDIMEDQVEGSDGYNFLNETQVKTFGFKDYIHSIQDRFVMMQDVWNHIEDFVFGRVYVDYDGFVQFTPYPTPLKQNNGFILTRNLNKTLDLADNTCLVTGMSFGFEDSHLVDSGYTNRMLGILQKDLVPDNINKPNHSNKTSNLSFEIAQLVRFPTNPNWELWAGVQIVDGTDADRHAQRSRWRICRRNTDGSIMNVGGIVDSFYGYEQSYNITEGGFEWVRIATEKTNIDSEIYYWLILSSVNASATTGSWEWYHDNGAVRGQSATASPNTSTATDGGSGWTYNKAGPIYDVILRRYKDQPMTCSFDGAIGHRSMIEQTFGTFNQQVSNYLAATKYFLEIGRLRCRPQRHYPGLVVRCPNRPIFEGDLFQIQVPEFNLSTPGRRAEYGMCSDVNWVFGNDAGEEDGLTALGTKFLNLSIRSFPIGY